MADIESLRLIGESMRRNRALLGLSVREAADRAGISKNTVLRLEAGMPVQKASLVKLSRAYGMVPIDQTEKRQKSVEGQHFRFQPADLAVWYATRLNADGQAESFTNPEVQDEAERNRLGWYGLASHFGQPYRIRRENSRFIAFSVEVYRPSDVTADPSGERLIFGLKGSVRVHVGDESFEVGEGEAAAYDATLPHWIEPATPVEAGTDPPRILQIVLP